MSVPPDSSASERGRRRIRLPAGSVAGLLAAGVAVIVSAAVSYASLQSRGAAAERVGETLSVLEQLQALLSSVKDAETGQRGYLLTGEDRYLAPYRAAQAEVPIDLATLRHMAAGDARRLIRVEMLAAAAGEKLAELQQTITLRRGGDAIGALAVVNSDRGRALMDRIRAMVLDMQRQENAVLAARQADFDAAARNSFVVALASAATLLLLIAAAAVLLARSHRQRETEVWLRSGLAGLGTQMLGVTTLEQLGDKVLQYLAGMLDAPVATLYLAEGESLRRVAGHADALPAPGSLPDAVRIGDGLLGQAARDGRLLHLADLPETHVQLRSSLGQAPVRELVVAPAGTDGIVHAVFEFGFLRPVEAAERELLVRVAPPFAVAVRSVRERQRTAEALAESQALTEELQVQQEELRVSNEELEERGRALKASQSQLEVQQAELEQTNSHLEEQAQLLEHQKDALAGSQAVLSAKADELDRSNRIKSEFLANMSHELRTPLNSTLILAKLLADNKDGNLSTEQVKFAQTISAAGHDLLALINDILDLSKIEAGKLEVQAESVRVAGVLEALTRAFEPGAREKGLDFKVTVAPGTPERLHTDAQRLGQILRNLLSNALKFTDKGEVALRVSAAPGDALAFAVQDSGIGIAPDQQALIFDAFHQADGSTHRRYGGTGLGLSISRDLARLLGGEIRVESVLGTGSVFTLTLPLTGAPAAAPPLPAAGQAASSPGASASSTAASPAPVQRPPWAAQPPPSPAFALPGRPAPAAEPPPAATQDGAAAAATAGAARLILVIEDDRRFAAILQDLARELGFDCVLTHNAADGLAAALRLRPSAVVLDMNLPDLSGLGVLDQLKHDPATRHIPVHVVSVADFSREALERGAVGYDLKPVPREQLARALEGLQARLATSLRRVLVVEDDARQLDAIRELLLSDDVRITGVANAADALAQLQANTFDCMVMDLNLPDLSGYELLQTMSERDDVAFPPVIVYTGRTLSRDEEMHLSRYSRSIIIKDARSPERLLDEVTLFLHQVEANLPPARQRMLREARHREATFEGRRILIVEDDVRNVFALSSVLEPKGAVVEIARNGHEALAALAARNGDSADPAGRIDLVLMDIMMPEMDGYTAMREIRSRPEWKHLPIIALTAKAMPDDQEKCLAAGASDYIAKPLDVEKLLSLVRVWMRK